MPKTTGIEYSKVRADHDPRPFGSTDKPSIVLLPAPERGGFDVRNCYPDMDDAAKLARRLRRLPILEAFYLQHAAGDLCELLEDGTVRETNHVG